MAFIKLSTIGNLSTRRGDIRSFVADSIIQQANRTKDGNVDILWKTLENHPETGKVVRSGLKPITKAANLFTADLLVRVARLMAREEGALPSYRTPGVAIKLGSGLRTTGAKTNYQHAPWNPKHLSKGYLANLARAKKKHKDVVAQLRADLRAPLATTKGADDHGRSKTTLRKRLQDKLTSATAGPINKTFWYERGRPGSPYTKGTPVHVGFSSAAKNAALGLIRAKPNQLTAKNPNKSSFTIPTVTRMNQSTRRARHRGSQASKAYSAKTGGKTAFTWGVVGRLAPPIPFKGSAAPLLRKLTVDALVSGTMYAVAKPAKGTISVNNWVSIMQLNEAKRPIISKAFSTNNPALIKYIQAAYKTPKKTPKK